VVELLCVDIAAQQNVVCFFSERNGSKWSPFRHLGLNPDRDLARVHLVQVGFGTQSAEMGLLMPLFGFIDTRFRMGRKRAGNCDISQTGVSVK
jgi:hypothetical protein